MKVVILAGGYGTRLSEETLLKPKPLVEIGGKPILWHIMKLFNHYNLNEFIICLGYKGEMIKDYFSNYLTHNNDLFVDIQNGRVEHLHNKNENWKVWLIDTGMETMTGGRMKRISNLVNGDTLLMTYGDGVSNVNIQELLDFHRKKGKLVTFTAVQPEGRFGVVHLDTDGTVKSFVEKPPGDGGWINGGFYVIDKRALDLIKGDDTIWEREPLETLASTRNLVGYKHYGFWKAMDTLSDKNNLESIWTSGKVPWKVW
jgi:glucose-1-phosphate cytidylyltransferase